METSLYFADLSESELGCRSEPSALEGGTFLDYPAINRPADSDIQTSIAAIRVGNDNFLYKNILPCRSRSSSRKTSFLCVKHVLDLHS